MNRRSVPAAIQVLLSTALLLGAAFALFFAPSSTVAAPDRAVIGTKELVRLTGPDGSIEALARVDTGAASTSIDEELAEDLGLDLDDAETVEITSSLGSDRRPVVAVDLQVAGESFATRANVADRSSRSTPVLLGRADLQGFLISTADERLTTPGSPKAPAALGSLIAQSSALGPTALLAVLPLATLMIVVLRVVGGLQTLGTFGPMLLAIGYTQAGLVPGLLLTIGMFVLGFLVQPVLRRMGLPRVVRLAVLVGVVTTALVTLQETAGLSGAVDSWGASLPVVVTAVIVERLWETWELDGLGDALRQAVLTLAVAAAVALVVVTPLVRLLADNVPVELAVVCTVAACVVGTYRGLRVNELLRFRHAAALEVAPERERVHA